MPDRSDSPWERLVDVLVRSEHSKADEQGTMLLTPVGVAVTLRDQVDLLTDLAFDAGRHHAAPEPEQIPLPVAWRMLASGDPGAVFDGVFLLLHPDGSVTWTQHPEEGVVPDA